VHSTRQYLQGSFVLIPSAYHTIHSQICDADGDGVLNSQELEAMQKACSFEEHYTLEDVRAKLNSMQSGLMPASGSPHMTILST
jgi:hypothetical protein